MAGERSAAASDTEDMAAEGAASADGVGRTKRIRRLPVRIRQARAARTYSRFVGMMKWFLPVVASIIVLGIAVYPEIKRRMTGFSPFSTGIDIESVGALAMVNGALEGIDEQSQRYHVRFAGATQSLADANLVELDQPQAVMELREGAVVSMFAQTGLFDRKIEQLDLFGDVRVYHDGGHEFRTESAHVELKSDSAAGDETVVGQSPLGTLKAEGFRITGRGELIRFLGRATLVLYPEQMDRQRGRNQQAARSPLPPIASAQPKGGAPDAKASDAKAGDTRGQRP